MSEQVGTSERLFDSRPIQRDSALVDEVSKRFRGKDARPWYGAGMKWSTMPPPKALARCLFVYPGVTSPGWASLKAGASNEATYMSHGMAYVSSALKARGHLAWLLDMRSCRSWPDFARRVAAEEYDVVFLGFLSHDAFTAAGTLRVLKEVWPARPVVVGGIHPTISEDTVWPPDNLPDLWLRRDPPQQLKGFLEWKGEAVYDPAKFPKANCVVWNEAEIASCLIAEAVAAGEPIPALVNAGTIPDLNETPHADRDLFDCEIEAQTPLLPFLPRPFFTITFGRGCPMACAFAFDPDALIQTTQGEYAIEKLKMLVRDEPFEAMAPGFPPQRIASINERAYTGKMIEIDTGLIPRLMVTEEHHVLVRTGRQHLEEIEARALVVGDVVVGLDGESMKVRGIATHPCEGIVYDITTEPDHVLVAGGILVKNCNIASQLSSSSVRLIKPDYFLDELEQLHARFGRIGSLMIHDDIILYPKWISSWCSGIRKRFGYTPFWLQMRADFVTKFPDLMAEMAESGMAWVSIGLECLDGDTQVTMDSGEVRAIKDARGNAIAADFNTRKFVKADSVLLDQYKVKNMARLSTNTREIIASHDHRFFKWGDGELIEARLKDLSVGDWVAVAARTPGLGSRTMSLPLAEMAGFLVGDGTVSKQKAKWFYTKGKRHPRKTDRDIVRMRFSQKRPDLLRHYANTIKDEFGVLVRVAKPPSRNTFTLETASRSVAAWALTIRPPGANGFREFPDIVTKGDDEVIAAFLRGYFDAEGSVIEKEKKISVSCKWRRPVEQTKHMLLRLGIESSRIARVDYTNKLGSFTDYRLYIRQADSVRIFSEKVGFLHPERRVKLARVVASLGESSRKGNYIPFSSGFLRRLAANYRGEFRGLREPIQRVMYGSSNNAARRCDLIKVVESIEAMGLSECEEVRIIKKWLDSDMSFEKIRKIEDVGERRAYDLHVPTHANFTANGFIVHNSGSQRLLDLMVKQTTVEQNIQACAILEALGVNVFGNWMLGLPTETPEDVKATADMMRRIRPGFHSASIYCDYPGTSLSRYLKSNGLLLDEWYTTSHYPWQRRIKGVDYELALRTRGQVTSEFPNRPQRPRLWPAGLSET